VLIDLLETRFGVERTASKARQLGREIPDERVELGEGTLFSWCVVGH
jgi:hypothetical protein